MYICYDDFVNLMAISDYQGPANHTQILKHLRGEMIKACFVDMQGHIWIVVPSGHAVVFAGFDTQAPAFSVEPPARVQEESDKRRADLQQRIQELKNLAPGVDV